MIERPRDVILFGAPGAGKGTQARRIAAKLGVTAIATGDMLREAAKAGTPFGTRAKQYMDAGALVPDEVMIGLVAEKIARPEHGAGFLLDGFPRTVAQGQALDEMLGQQGREVSVIGIEVPEDELLRRLSERWTCPTCQRTYGQRGACEADGAVLAQRDDDKPETVRKRLETYRTQTAPLKDFYQARGRYRGVSGLGTVDEVWSRIEKAIDG